MSHTGFGYMTSSGLHPLTMSDTSQLTIKNALARKPLSLVIRGNTVNGSGVGDKTDNLFNFSAWLESLPISYPIYNGTYTVTDDSITLTATADDCYTRTWDPASTSHYRIAVKPDTEYRLTWHVSGDSGLLGIFNNGSYASGYGKFPRNYLEECIFTTTSDAQYITIRFGVGSKGGKATYSKIQLILKFNKKVCFFC